MTRRIFVDTEWIALPWSDDCDLMWIGLANEEGDTWYGISSEVEINPAENDFISGAFKLISPDEPRLTRAELAAAVVDFCGKVDQFWAWIPAQESFAAWFKLGDEAADIYANYWNTDLQQLQALVQPWPSGWPDQLHNLNTAVMETGIEIPPRAENHLHPRVHSEWNQELFRRIRASKKLFTGLS